MRLTRRPVLPSLCKYSKTFFCLFFCFLRVKYLARQYNCLTKIRLFSQQSSLSPRTGPGGDVESLGNVIATNAGGACVDAAIGTSYAAPGTSEIDGDDLFLFIKIVDNSHHRLLKKPMYTFCLQLSLVLLLWSYKPIPTFLGGTFREFWL